MGEASDNVCDLLLTAAAEFPDKPAISCQGVTRTWQETLQRCHAAATLFASLGVGKGDRVAYLGLNSSVLFESYYSPALIGAILVPVNYRLSLPELLECLEDCRPTVLIVDDQFLEQGRELRQRCPFIRHLIPTGDAEHEGLIGLEPSLAEIQEGELCQLSPGSGRDLLMIFYTGGTTGRAKGVMLSHRNLLANTRCSLPLYRMQPHWRFIVLGPLFHLAAGSRVFACAALAGHAVILPKFDVEAVLQTIQNYRIHSATLVPTMLQMLLDHPDFARYDLSSMQMLSTGAAPMPRELMRRIIATFPQVPVFQTYGMTEASPILTSLDSTYHVLDGPMAGRLASVGRAVPHVDLMIADEEDRPLGPGVTGQILARGENIMEGYWQLPKLSDEALRGGWYHTGDAGYLDEEGFLFLEGRVKDMIVSGGENVYPIEVENALSSHQAVKSCAVIGIPHDTWGEAVHAVVVLEAGAESCERDLIGYCRERIAHYKCPVSVSFRQAMPLSPINKILKSELRKPFWEGRGNQLV